MALEPADWTIDRSTKVISYIGDDHGGASPSYATVIQLHRWLQGLADDAVATSDDELDITNIDPSRRSTDNIITLINGYTIGSTEAEHLYDGSIIYSDGDEIYDGIVNFGNADVQIQIIQNGNVLADDWWNFNGGGLNANATSGISHRFMIKTRTGGADIDNRRLIGTCRRYGYTYAEFNINATARGNNVLALTDSTDLNNTTASSTVATWTGIVNSTIGYAAIDVNNNSVDEYYYSEWDRAGYTINQFYERMKYLTRDGTAETLYGLNGEVFRGITHQIEISGGAGTWTEPEHVSWGTGSTVGTGRLLAVDDTVSSSATKMWIQLLTGVVPNANTITGSTSSATATAGTVTERTISTPFCGQSTGAAIIGAYGFGIEALDLTSNDKVTDLGANVITPPNYVTNTVTGLVGGQDYLIIAPWDGVSVDANSDPAFDKDQLSLNGTLNTANVATINIASSVPADTPSSGTIRLADDDGYERRLPYSSWSGSAFTLDTGSSTMGSNNDFDGLTGSGTYQATTGNNVYITYLDQLATTTSATFTSVQAASRNLVLLVRDGGATPIKQFISEWSQTTSPQSISVIRTSDA